MNGNQNDTVTLNFERLKAVSALGRGAKGVVFLVIDEEFNEFLALKVILRDSIEKKSKSTSNSNNNENGNGNGNDHYKRVCFEQKVLKRFNHPLLPRLRGVLSTEKIVGYAIDYCPGRDLNYLRKKQTEKMFSVDIIRFFAAELVLALEYLHNLGIAYRDLKPENIMIQENGHVMLVDFDLSTNLAPKSPHSSPSPKQPDSVTKNRFSPFHNWCNSGISPEDSVSSSSLHVNNSATKTTTESDSSEKSNSFVGTEEYVAPEIILGKGHDFAVDWWSLGIVLYEMLYGATPFKGSSRKETFYRILSKKPELVGEPTPLRDLIKKLLEKNSKQRIELEGIKGHDFFRGVDWDMILLISRPPYIPAVTVDDSNSTEGIEKIDVELFVQGIFCGGSDVEKIKVDERNHDNRENIDKKVWVKELNHQPCETDNFLVF